MSDTRAAIRELRSLSEKRSTDGLTEQERSRLAELRERLGLPSEPAEVRTGGPRPGGTPAPSPSPIAATGPRVEAAALPRLDASGAALLPRLEPDAPPGPEPANGVAAPAVSAVARRPPSRSQWSRNRTPPEPARSSHRPGDGRTCRAGRGPSRCSSHRSRPSSSRGRPPVVTPPAEVTRFAHPSPSEAATDPAIDLNAFVEPRPPSPEPAEELEAEGALPLAEPSGRGDAPVAETPFDSPGALAIPLDSPLPVEETSLTWGESGEPLPEAQETVEVLPPAPVEALEPEPAVDPEPAPRRLSLAERIDAAAEPRRARRRGRQHARGRRLGRDAGRCRGAAPRGPRRDPLDVAEPGDGRDAGRRGCPHRAVLGGRHPPRGRIGAGDRARGPARGPRSPRSAPRVRRRAARGPAGDRIRRPGGTAHLRPGGTAGHRGRARHRAAGIPSRGARGTARAGRGRRARGARRDGSPPGARGPARARGARRDGGSPGARGPARARGARGTGAATASAGARRAPRLRAAAPVRTAPRAPPLAAAPRPAPSPVPAAAPPRAVVVPARRVRDGRGRTTGSGAERGEARAAPARPPVPSQRSVRAKQGGPARRGAAGRDGGGGRGRPRAAAAPHRSPTSPPAPRCSAALT